VVCVNRFVQTFLLVCGMFQKLQQKWKVSPTQLFLVIATFALGGSATGILARRLMRLIPVEQPFIYGLFYLLILTLIWPLMVILVSIPLGQFSFFSNYLQRMFNRLTRKKSTLRLAIFASGSGSNAEQIMAYFDGHPSIEVTLVVSNKADAGVLAKALTRRVETLVIKKDNFFNGDGYIPLLKEKQIDFIALAGFLLKIPPALIRAFPARIVNIHPALLPKYGGKGMYGHFVHEAVVAAGEAESGITIHFVDEQYDHGATIFQATCPVNPQDTPVSLAAKVLQLEHQHFPRIIEQTMLTQVVKK
jgi:formyltetrahydrofolate-dependent phosphoribosylglycinamide formyltransferase